MNTIETINALKNINDVEVLATHAETETRKTVLNFITKKIADIKKEKSTDFEEKTVKIKFHGETIEQSEADYLAALEYYGENYPGELITE